MKSDETVPLLTKTNEIEHKDLDEIKRKVCLKSLWKKLRYIISYISVEPAIFLASFSEAGAKVYDLQLTIDKVCLFHYSEDVCANLDNGNNTNAQDLVQRTSSDFNIYRHYIEYIPSIFISLILANVFNSRYKYYAIVYPYFCYFLFSLGFLLNAIWLTAHPVYVILAYIPLGMTGGILSSFMIAYLLIVEITEKESRSSRMAVIIGLKYIASPLGTCSSTVLFNYLGYVAAFSLQSTIFFLAFVYVALRFKKLIKLKEIDKNSSWDQPLTLRELLKTITTTFSIRPISTCIQVIGYIIILSLDAICLGSSNYIYLYSRKRFSWDYKTYSFWYMLDNPLGGLGSLIAVPILSYLLKIRDSVLCIMGGLSAIGYYIVIGLAQKSWWLYMASVIGILHHLISSATRAQMSKLVSEDKINAVFATTNVIESFSPLLSSLVLGLIYNATLSVFPGTMFIVVAAIEIVGFSIAIWFTAAY